MNFKHYIYSKVNLAGLAVCLVTAGTALTSCDDYLTDESQSHVTTDMAYGSITNLKKNALLSIYNNIGGNKPGEGLQGTELGVYDLNSLTTDEQIVPVRSSDWYDGGLWISLFMHKWSPGTAPLKNSWDYLYKVVMLCNESIERIDAFQTDIENEKIKLRQYKEEIRALRAVYYFYLMDLFGRVPLVTSTSVKSSEMQLNDRSKTFYWIYNELLEAIPYLSVLRSTSTNSECYGRVTRDVAYFVMMKLAINAEIYTDDNWTDNVRPDGSKIMLKTYLVKDNKFIEKNAWDTVDEIARILDREYSLSTAYVDNFELTNEESKENIFTIPMDPRLYSNKYTYFNRSRHYQHGAALGEGGENGPCATVSTIKTFGYGKPPRPQNSIYASEEQVMGQWACDRRFYDNFYADSVFAKGDYVYEYGGETKLIYYPLEVTSIDLSGDEHEKTAGARIAKYSRVSTVDEAGRWDNNDIVLFRYADVLLMQAEAKYRKGETTDALNLVNKVYSRSNGMGAYSEINDDVLLNERLKEFMWEGWRRNDLIRFGRFHKAYDLKTEEYSEHEKDGHTTVFPIPADLMAMHPDWKQNPGY